MPTNPTPVEVVEPPVPGRVRRPTDALRLLLVVALLVIVIAVADLAVGTTGALERDLALVTGGLPRVLLQLFSWLGGVGVVVLPLAVGVVLVLRGRYWQLVQALLAAGVGALVVIALSALILGGHLGGVLGALTRPLSAGYTEPLDAVLVSIVALLTVADISGRRGISALATVVIGSFVVTVFLSGASTALSIFCSLLLGWAVGLVFRYAFGATSTRPAGAQIADVLVARGIPLTRLELVGPDGGTRFYVGHTPTGVVDVRVMDSDALWSASARRLVRLARLRGASTRPPALSLRADLEHRTLMGLALAQAAIPAPTPVAVSEVGPFSAVIAYVKPTGTTVAQLGRDLDDAQLAEIWRLLGTLRRRSIAHRGLAPDVVMITADGRAGLRRTGAGDIAANDLTLRIDTAQLLTTVALAVGADRAVTTAVAEVGEEAVVRALPLLQPLALTRSTREALEADKALLGALRERILLLRPSPDKVEPVELRRLSPRGVVTVVGGGIAAYLLLTQLAKVDLVRVVESAKWGWALATAGCAVLTFAGASIALRGSVNARLTFARTYMTQLAVAFSGLVAPAAIGNLALNTRYLQKAGVRPAVAAASVGLAQIAQFCSYFALLVTSGVLAGTGPQASFTPPPELVAAVPIVIVVVLALLAVPRVRHLVTARVLPQVRRVLPQVLSVLQHPRKLGQLLGGALLLDLSFVAALVCATRAFGAQAPVAAVAVVYFAGAIIGSAVPTPGGLGGIEAAMSAGLIAIGLDGGTAVSSVLLYRLATFWLPIPFGWVALNRLQKRHAI
ncbi:MAG TPA: lysylphosphatidylglycerol synthase transmembrane domain-containing protein [Intrasporangium sp.]|uniref:lysylphosphatidylglycerol synthase transmembrane domain-containing protein n=1 Tax=Intrasporangium sp. TaxID=1925024 RepID=UPI002D7912EC|nr:lysylphosphatidylglycerol synthase transmembrane domain-containing protein [Intrasporangium sp.]HET7399359.1 lysylphosphatidylglycerol synthase transmembrane domain-containing protein [Intrasporangium sp.]